MHTRAAASAALVSSGNGPAGWRSSQPNASPAISVSVTHADVTTTTALRQTTFAVVGTDCQLDARPHCEQRRLKCPAHDRSANFALELRTSCMMVILCFPYLRWHGPRTMLAVWPCCLKHRRAGDLELAEGRFRLTCSCQAETSQFFACRLQFVQFRHHGNNLCTTYHAGAHCLLSTVARPHAGVLGRK